jgi:hypothetical protein
LSSTKTIQNELNLSNIKSWKQTIVAIGITGVNLLGIIRLETVIYSTIIIVAFVCLMAYIVKRSTMSKDIPIGTELSFHVKGLKILLSEIKFRKSNTNITQECDCFDKMILEINNRVNFYKNIKKK